MFYIFCLAPQEITPECRRYITMQHQEDYFLSLPEVQIMKFKGSKRPNGFVIYPLVSWAAQYEKLH